MRRLTVRHVTTYRYTEPVTFGEHHMMFRPRESHDLRLVSTRLVISPEPTAVRWVHDVFDNSVAIATFARGGSELRFESTVTLEQVETALPDYTLTDEARVYPFAYSDDEGPDLANARRRRYPESDLATWAQQFVEPAGQGSPADLLQAMLGGINENFTYVAREARGVQSPAETLERRSGSCRDFAVLMMEAVRSLGFAARFVSGYIFVPDHGRTGVVGGGATHGWMQAYLPGAGWVDFDPTNRIAGNRHLIRVAVAWDQRNALPLWGTFYGSPACCVGMQVDVSVTEG